MRRKDAGINHGLPAVLCRDLSKVLDGKGQVLTESQMLNGRK